MYKLGEEENTMTKLLTHMHSAPVTKQNVAETRWFKSSYQMTDVDLNRSLHVYIF